MDANNLNDHTRKSFIEYLKLIKAAHFTKDEIGNNIYTKTEVDEKEVQTFNSGLTVGTVCVIGSDTKIIEADGFSFNNTTKEVHATDFVTDADKLSDKLDAIGSSSDNSIVLSDGTSGDIKESSISINGGIFSSLSTGSELKLWANGGVGLNDRVKMMAVYSGGGSGYGGKLVISTRNSSNVYSNQVEVSENGNVLLNHSLDVEKEINASRDGIFGRYDSAQVQGVWSVSNSFKVDTDANNFGTQYGLVYSHTNAGTGGLSKPLSGYGHQICFVAGGNRAATISLDNGSAHFKGNITSEKTIISSSTNGRVGRFGDGSFADKWISFRDGTAGVESGFNKSVSNGAMIVKGGINKGFGVATNSSKTFDAIRSVDLSLYVDNNGEVKLGKYGSGNQTGDGKYSLEVDSSGKIVEKMISSPVTSGHSDGSITFLGSKDYRSNTTDNYAHIRLEINTSTTSCMFLVNVTGYAYGSDVAEDKLVDLTFTGYSYAPNDTIQSMNILNRANNAITSSIYKGSDNHVYLRFLTTSQYYLSFRVEAQNVGNGPKLSQEETSIIFSTDSTL